MKRDDDKVPSEADFDFETLENVARAFDLFILCERIAAEIRGEIAQSKRPEVQEFCKETRQASKEISQIMLKLFLTKQQLVRIQE